MVANFKTIKSKLIEQFSKLSKREQAMIVLCVAFVVGMGIYSIISPINEAFASLDKNLNDSFVRARATSGAVERYLKLKSRRDAIEQKYKEVEFKEGALSYIEGLIKTKAGIPSGFTIKDGTPRAFGGGYDQVPISIRFSTSNLSALVDFLKQLVSDSSHPLIVSKLDITKPRVGGRIDIDMDVSSLRKAEVAPSPEKK